MNGDQSGFDRHSVFGKVCSMFNKLFLLSILLNTTTRILFCHSFLSLLAGLFISTFLSAQQPAYFTLGEEQFSGVQIYDIIQDKDLNYLFATNEGIYYYDYYNYRKIECNEAKSNSAFNFVMDEDGAIYCHNLNNQIFKINGTSCSLYYELKNDETKADISLAFANDGSLVIGSGMVIVIKKDRSHIYKYPLNSGSLGPVFTTPNKEIQFHLSSSDSILTYLNGKFSTKKLNFTTGDLTPVKVLKFFAINGKNYAFDQRTKLLYDYNIKQLTLTLVPKNALSEIEGAIRLYELGEDVWAAGTFPGVKLFQNKMDDQPRESFYKDFFISNVYKDKEGNVLLGTFDKGILVIPDLKIPDVINFIPDDPIISIYVDGQKSIYMGSSKGKLILYANGEIKIISDGGKHPVEGIYGSEYGDLIIFDNGYIRAYNKNDGKVIDLSESSLKDAAIVSNNEFYLGTNNGIIRVEPNNPHSYFVIPVPEIRQRIYSIEYNPVNKNVYTSSADGLFVLFPSGKIQKIKYHDADIFPNDLCYSNGRIFANTHKDGILIMESDKVTGSIQPIVNGKTEDLKKIVIHENTIIGNSTTGLFRFDMNGKLLNAIHTTYRLKSNRIVDFAIDKEALWVCHSGGVQMVKLDYSRSNVSAPVIRFDNIQVNDEPIVDFKKGVFKNDERKIQFTFSSPTLKDRENISYHYKLTGYDEEWKVQSYEQNEVTYNALGPGTYTFELKAENQGTFSNILSYSFIISKPFYANWWFIALTVLLFLVIVYIIYKWQLSIQNKKAKQFNELNASKLTAIQSQMNPHFIFNSLNSIQDLILKGDVEHSYSYITTFSNLVRRTLSYSEKDFIDFEQEIKLLELYLSLEKLRYKKDLNYYIEVKNVEDIMLPPLLIQPFIENALVHGLLHKEGEKNLKIRFELKDHLICTIEDNGIGRERAKSIKERQRSDHESFSGKAIHKRFEILSNVFKGEFGYFYEDLYENNQPVGTRVVLTIPVKRKF